MAGYNKLDELSCKKSVGTAVGGLELMEGSMPVKAALTFLAQIQL